MTSDRSGYDSGKYNMGNGRPTWRTPSFPLPIFTLECTHAITKKSRRVRGNRAAGEEERSVMTAQVYFG